MSSLALLLVTLSLADLVSGGLSGTPQSRLRVGRSIGLLIWLRETIRPTRDADLLGLGLLDRDTVADIIKVLATYLPVPEHLHLGSWEPTAGNRRGIALGTDAHGIGFAGLLRWRLARQADWGSGLGSRAALV